MKKQYRLLLFLLLTYSSTALSQNIGKVWYFGQYAGMNFSTTPPTPLVGAMVANKGCATLTNSVDNTIIAYTDGKTLYNKNHQIALNGSSLNGDGQASNSSYFLPYPNKPNTAILFTVDAWGVYQNVNPNSKGLCYSIVKVDSSTGLAYVVSGQKNILLKKPTSEKLAVTKHANGIDYWVVTHGAASTNNENRKYFAYLVTNAGVSPTPVVSTVGGIHNNPIGELNISPNGQKVCATTFYSNWAELLNFNNSTGVVSNPVHFTIPRCLGVEFSPNSQYVYITETGPNDPNSIRQINIATNNMVSIANITGAYTYSQMATAPDGNIYVANSGSTFLGKITNPNNANATYIKNGLALAPTGVTSRLSVPYATEMPITMCIATQTTDTICHGASVTLADSINGQSVTWTFNPPLQSPDNFVNNVLTLYNATGSIKNTVCSASNISCANTRQISVYPEIAKNPTKNIAVCSNQSINIGTNANANYSYQWSPANNLNNPNISNPTVSISNIGNSVLVQKYYLTRTLVSTGCSVVDTVAISVAPNVVFQDTNICHGASVTLADSINGQSVVWTFNPPLQSPDNFVNNVLTLYNATSSIKNTVCSASNIPCANTRQISVYPEIAKKPTKNIAVCSGAFMNIGVSAVAGFSYQWSPVNNLNNPNISNPTVSISNTGNSVLVQKYYLTRTLVSTGCSVVDTVAVSVAPNVVFQDTNICHGASVTLADSINEQSVVWTFSPSLQSPDNFVNNVLTLYNATGSIKNTVCSASNIPCADSLQVGVYPKLQPNATALFQTCSNQPVSIGTVADANYSYQWSPANNLTNPNISNPTVSISNTGNSVLVQKYYLTRTLVSTGCSVVDTVAVSVAPNVVFQDTNICHGASIMLADSINGESVTWTFNPPLQSPDNFVNNVLTLYNATGSIKNTVCSASNISCADSLMISVYSSMIVNPTIYIQTCDSQPVNIGTNVNANYSYHWFPGTYLNDSTISNPIFMASNNSNQTTKYKYLMIRTVLATGCTVVDTVVVSIPPSVALKDTNICHGASVTLADSINGQSVVWTFNPPLQSPDNFVNNVLTLYNATSSIKNTVCSASNIPCSDSLQVGVYPKLQPNATALFQTCSNQSINIGTNANANYSYQWSPANNLTNPNISNPTVSISNTGNSVLVQKYYLTRTLVSTGCSVVDTVAVSVAPNVVFQDTNICHGASVTLADSINGESVTWAFSPPLQAPDNFTNNVLTLYNATGSIKNTVCSASNIPCSDSLQVGVYPKLQSNATALFQTCSNQSINIGTNANANYSYQWLPANNLTNPNISNPTVKISNTGNSVLVQKYYLTRTVLATGCKVVDTVVVSIPPSVALKDTNICTGASVTLADSLNGQSVVWTFNPPLQAPDNFTNNVLTLYNESYVTKKINYSASNISCAATATVSVDKIAIDANGHLICSELFIPNIITKNGDGKNDFLKIEGLNLFKTNKLQIYNRWGKKMYEQTDYNSDWNGESFMSGTYFYLLELTTYTGQTLSYKGWIDVME